MGRAAEFPLAVWETIYVTVLATAFAIVIGLPLGVLLVIGEKDGILRLPPRVLQVLNGIIGGGGQGKIAINYGYYQYKYRIMLAAVVLLILLVQTFQGVGTRLAIKTDKRMKTKSN